MSVNIVEQESIMFNNNSNSSLKELGKYIEKCGRICYKSHDLINENSYIKFSKMILNKNHLTVFEHYNIILEVDFNIYAELKRLDYSKYQNPVFIRMSKINKFIISGNIRSFRSLYENFKNNLHYSLEIISFLKEKYDFLFDLDEIHQNIPNKNVWFAYIDNFSEEERRIHETITFHFITSRGVTHELVRHKQQIVYSQESTRYCDYTKGKFGESITVTKPVYLDPSSPEYNCWIECMESCNKNYTKLRKLGWVAEKARGVLPIDLKTEIIVTATIWEWDQIFAQRLSKFAHPNIRYLMIDTFNIVINHYPKELFIYTIKLLEKEND